MFKNALLHVNNAFFCIFCILINHKNLFFSWPITKIDIKKLYLRNSSNYNSYDYTLRPISYTKETHLGPKQRVWHRSGLFHNCCLSHHVHCRLQYTIYAIINIS